jgi:glutamate N-acetyltransferase/amino-acid N-acetyltransferase
MGGIMNKVSGGVIAPRGFKATGVASGIKISGKKDMALILSDKPCTVGAVFTTNIFKAAPIIVSQEIIKANPTGIRGIVANSGNANCLTGEEGIRNARTMVEITEKYLNLPSNSILVASTGIIGKQLPMSIVEYGISKLVQRISVENSSSLAAEGIMTTDTKIKQTSYQYISGLESFRIGAIGKGSGMINPSMATMLCFVTTDAKISYELLNEALREAVEETFNRITVDGDMSTNDTVFVLANGNSSFEVKEKDEKYQIFLEHLKATLNDIALMIVEDGEGVTKVVKINVINAKKQEEAEKVARRVANSLLVKTMLFGENPNWGRIIAAIGSSGVNINPSKLQVKVNNVTIFEEGNFIGYEKNNILKDKMITIDINLNLGKFSYFVYSTDLSYDYVKINAEYT